MKKNTPKPINLAYRLCCFVLPLIALGAIFYFTNDFVFSLVASLVVASMVPMTRFIYELNSDK